MRSYAVRKRLLPVVFGVLMVGLAYATYGYAPGASMEGCKCERYEYPPGSKIKQCVLWRCKVPIRVPFPGW